MEGGFCRFRERYSSCIKFVFLRRDVRMPARCASFDTATLVREIAFRLQFTGPKDATQLQCDAIIRGGSSLSEGRFRRPSFSEILVSTRKNRPCPRSDSGGLATQQRKTLEYLESAGRLSLRIHKEQRLVLRIRCSQRLSVQMLRIHNHSQWIRHSKD